MQEDRSELLHSVQDEARRLHSYVQNLLDATRIGSPDFQLKRDWVDLADLVESARRRLDSSWRQHKLLVHFDQQIPGSMCTVPRSSRCWSTSSTTPPATRRPAPHRVQGDAGGPDLIIDIIDIGVGIAESDRDKIFNLFTPSRWDCGSRGTGLGLAISRAMIEVHGGRIWAFAGPQRQRHLHAHLPAAGPSTHRRYMMVAALSISKGRLNGSHHWSSTTGGHPPFLRISLIAGGHQVSEAVGVTEGWRSIATSTPTW